MKKSKEHLKLDKQLDEAIRRIPADKWDRAIIALEYMVTATREDAQALAEYSSREDVSLDMIVAWVKNKQKELTVNAG